jgi:4a-hydroxytetrahydrobiopterin dehydratase
VARRLDDEEIRRQVEDLPGWYALRGALHSTVAASTFADAAALVAEVARIADELDHHPDVDLRWTRVRFELSTHSEGGVTQLDVELAHRISAEAAATTTGTVPARLEVGIDAADASALIPFWRTGLGYVEASRVDDLPQLSDPTGLGPVVWFQGMDPPRTDRSRTHLDIYLPRATAEQRVADVLAAGGRLASDAHAPSWWVLADAEGNELCVCTDAPEPAGG